MWRVLGAGILLALAWPADADACCCPGIDAVDALKDPDLEVFTGRAVRFVETEWFSFALIEVERVWSGNVGPHVILDVHVTSCGHPDVWTPGAENLFVTAPDLFTSSTSNCLGNEPLASAGPMLRRLGPGHPPRGYAALAIPLLLFALGGVAAAAWRLRRRGSTSVRRR